MKVLPANPSQERLVTEKAVTEKAVTEKAVTEKTVTSTATGGIRCVGIVCRAPRGFLGPEPPRVDKVNSRATVQGKTRLEGVQHNRPQDYIPGDIPGQARPGEKKLLIGWRVPRSPA